MQYLFLIGCYMIVLGQGYSEGLGWKWIYEGSPDADEYHKWRFLLETLGVVIAIITYSYFSSLWYWQVIVVANLLVVYEWAFKTARKGKPFYRKQSKWFGIPHPPFMLEFIIWTISLVFIKVWF